MASENGLWVAEVFHDTSLTNAGLREMIANGYVFYYTCGESSSSGDDVITDIDMTRITVDMVPSNANQPTATLFDGFVATSADVVKSNTPSNDCYVIIDFDEQGFYILAFRDGAWDENAVHDTSLTNAGLYEMIADGEIFYYTCGESSSGGESGPVKLTYQNLSNRYIDCEVFIANDSRMHCVCTAYDNNTSSNGDLSPLYIADVSADSIAIQCDGFYLDLTASTEYVQFASAIMTYLEVRNDGALYTSDGKFLKYMSSTNSIVLTDSDEGELVFIYLM